MNTQDISTDITAVQAILDSILATLAFVDPAFGPTAATAQIIADLTAKLATAAFTAFGNASGTPITVESIQALLPNQTPLSAPDGA